MTPSDLKHLLQSALVSERPHTTSDIDLVVEGRSRDDLDVALTEFGFSRHGRHSVLGEHLVEVPGNWMSDPTDVVAVGPLTLRVVKKEVVLADRNSRLQALACDGLWGAGNRHARAVWFAA